MYNRAALKELFIHLAIFEPHTILKTVKKKSEARIGMARGIEEKALAEYNDTPVKWAADSCLVKRNSDNSALILRPDWESIYDREALMGACPMRAARSYLDALSWTLAYYAGMSVDMCWYYPWFHPPRAATILALETDIVIPTTVRTPISPIEQLAMVLPTSSFHLLPTEYSALPVRHPAAWPLSWGVHSFGRRFLWECEPLIPLIQPEQIKRWIDEVYEIT